MLAPPTTFSVHVGPADYVLFIDKKPVGVVEAKPEDWGQKITTVEEQSAGYAAAKLKWVNKKEPLPFVYESTGVLTRFTDTRDPRPRSREIFNFPRPETTQEWHTQPASLRARLRKLPVLDATGLRACQLNAIEKLEESFKDDRPRALIQMATGSGKTYAAITSIYRLLKHADAKRILFLVDTKNLGEQAEQEFMAYVPNDDNRKFTELYNVQRLKSSFVANDSQVCISTIQRMYSLLKDQEMDEAAETINPAEMVQPKPPMSVVYNGRIPPEFFDFIIIDECHRSIYNLWRQVLEYFDASLIGLTATPDNRTYGFFRKNVVSEYAHEQAVADGVNVGNEIYVIDTEKTKHGGQLGADQWVEKRERLTRRKRWEIQDEDVTYAAEQLDRDIVNPDQIRTVVRTFRDKRPEIFPGRAEVPKTLVFAKTDSHADDIIQIVREEFAEGNEFCKKITYKAEEDPKSVLAQFRNDYYPRIAVTVDMIATGTDVRPLECLLFMRDVRSRNYFEQMKGRGPSDGVDRRVDRVVGAGEIGPQRRQIPAERGLEGRPAGAEQVIGHAQAWIHVRPRRHPFDWREVALRKPPGRSRRDRLGRHMRVEVIDPQAVVQCQTIDGPLILRVGPSVRLDSEFGFIRCRPLVDAVWHRASMGGRSPKQIGRALAVVRFSRSMNDVFNVDESSALLRLCFEPPRRAHQLSSFDLNDAIVSSRLEHLTVENRWTKDPTDDLSVKLESVRDDQGTRRERAPTCSGNVAVHSGRYAN